MKTKLFLKIVAMLVVCTIVFSCTSDETTSEVTHVPFKSSENGKWGMIGIDGTVLFEEEFSDEPTVVKNGRFFVLKENHMWDIYTAEEKPKKIGGDYKNILMYETSVTPSVKKNERICLIDIDGNVIATLDKEILDCSEFKSGYAVIHTIDSKSGIINTKGEIVIEPKDELFYVYPFSRWMFASVKQVEGKLEKIIKFYDKNGKWGYTMKFGEGHKYAFWDYEKSTSDYMAVEVSVDGEFRTCLIDCNEETILKPSIETDNLFVIQGDKFNFYDGEHEGVMNFKGETVLEAKYDMLLWVNDDRLFAGYRDDTEFNYYLINTEGKKITDDMYMDVNIFDGGKYAGVKISDNRWTIIETESGKEIQNIPKIYCLIKDEEVNNTITSDFLDVDAITSELKLHENGLMGFSLDMMTQDIINAYKEVERNEYARNEAIPEKYKDRNYVTTQSYLRYSGGLSIKSTVYYNRPMTLLNFKFDVSHDWWERRIIWSKEKPSYIEARISGSGLDERADLLYKKISTIIKSYGIVIRENSNAVIVKIFDERGWVITSDESNINIKIYNDADYKYYNIDSYAKDGEITKTFINNLDEGVVYDTLGCDTPDIY